MIRPASARSRRRFNCVETVGLDSLANTATGCKVARMPDAAGAVAKEVRVDRQNDIRLIKLVCRVQELAKGKLRTHTPTVSEWLPLVPLRGGIKVQNGLNLRTEGGR